MTKKIHFVKSTSSVVVAESNENNKKITVEREEEKKKDMSTHTKSTTPTCKRIRTRITDYFGARKKTRRCLTSYTESGRTDTAEWVHSVFTASISTPMTTPFGSLPGEVVSAILMFVLDDIRAFFVLKNHTPDGVARYWSGDLQTLRNWEKQAYVLSELLKLRLVSKDTQSTIDACAIWKEIAFAFGYERGELHYSDDWEHSFSDATRRVFAEQFNILAEAGGYQFAIKRWRSLNFSEDDPDAVWPGILKNAADKIKNTWDPKIRSEYEKAQNLIPKDEEKTQINSALYNGFLYNPSPRWLCYRTLLLQLLPSYLAAMHMRHKVMKVLFFSVPETKKIITELPPEYLNMWAVQDSGLGPYFLSTPEYVERLYLCNAVPLKFFETPKPLLVSACRNLQEVIVENITTTNLTVKACPRLCKVSIRFSTAYQVNILSCSKFDTLDLLSSPRERVMPPPTGVVTKNYNSQGTVGILNIRECPEFKKFPHPTEKVYSIAISNCPVDLRAVKLSEYAHLEKLLLHKVQLPTDDSWVDAKPGPPASGFILSVRDCAGKSEESDILGASGLVSRLTDDSIVAWNGHGRIGLRECCKTFQHSHAKRIGPLLGFKIIMTNYTDQHMAILALDPLPTFAISTTWDEDKKARIYAMRDTFGDFLDQTNAVDAVNHLDALNHAEEEEGGEDGGIEEEVGESGTESDDVEYIPQNVNFLHHFSSESEGEDGIEEFCSSCDES